MENIILTKKISISPGDFSNDIVSILSDKLKKIPCSEKYGYILDINTILSYESLLSRTTGNNIYTIKFEANTLKPQIGKKLNCIVVMTLPNGILAEFLDIKLLVPSSHLQDYEYKNQTFYNDKRVITIGDQICVLIKDIRYIKNKFNCIGTLI
jgi:DNA-directed RNA polymerase subunit E'/Rpb7